MALEYCRTCGGPPVECHHQGGEAERDRIAEDLIAQEFKVNPPGTPIQAPAALLDHPQAVLTQDAITDLEQFISTNAVAEMFEVTAETVRNWINDGKIKAFKVGPVYRLRKKDVIDFANAHYGD